MKLTKQNVHRVMINIAFIDKLKDGVDVVQGHTVTDIQRLQQGIEHTILMRTSSEVMTNSNW